MQEWATIAYEVYMTITSANVAVAWLHDLGGFIPQPGARRSPWIYSNQA